MVSNDSQLLSWLLTLNGVLPGIALGYNVFSFVVVVLFFLVLNKNINIDTRRNRISIIICLVIVLLLSSLFLGLNASLVDSIVKKPVIEKTA